MRIDYAELLDFLWDTLAFFNRRDCGRLLGGLRPEPPPRRVDETLHRLEQQGLVARQGRGEQARFTVTAAGQQRAARPEPSRAWDRPWDGKWRVVVYDLPERRRHERFVLWEALRNQRLGLLQRSVWVWPHDLEPVLVALVQARGFPGSFCGFVAAELLLCTDAEVVGAAWDWPTIDRRQEAYREQTRARWAALRKAADPAALVRVASAERHAYGRALGADPFLPRTLCPVGYQGFAVEQAHQEFRVTWRKRLAEVTR